MRDQRFRLFALAAALSLLPGLARSSAGVMTWRQSWSGPDQVVLPPSMAARELADGSTMIVGPPALRFDHDGNLLSTANFSPPFFSSFTFPPPNIFQESLVAIDPFGGVFIASAADLSSIEGDIWLMKYNGFTGKAMWSKPLTFDESTHRQDLPLFLFLDSAGNAVVVGSSHLQGTVAMKVEGTTGNLLWGPTIVPATFPRAALDPAGSLVLAVIRGNAGFSDLYKFNGQTGGLDWGPIQFAGSSGETVTAFEAGPDGSVFVAGTTINGIKLFKYNGVTGSVLWGPVLYTENSPTQLRATDIVVGAGGDVIVSGISSDHLLILKYGGAAGNLLWGPQIRKPIFTNIAQRVRIAGNGDVVVSAWDRDSTLSTWRYGGTTGSLLWGPQTVSGATSDMRRPLTLICSNGRILTAFSGPSGLSTLERDSATGTPVWGPVPFTRTVPGTVRVTDVTQDSDGNVLVTGYLAFSSTFVTAKLARSNGAVLWVALSPVQDGVPMTVRTDASGNVFVLGQLGSLLKYSGTTGALIWQKEPGVSLYGWRLAIDASGDVMVAEQLVKGTFGTEYDFVTFKFSGVTGATLWGPVVFDRGPGTSDWPTAIAITPGGDVVVAGISQNSSPSSPGEWVTIKYSGATGSVIWGPSLLSGTLPLNRDNLEDLKIDAAGDIVEVGRTNSDTSSPITTIKYSGTTGAVIWGPLKTPQDGSATGVALGTNGDVLVTGYAYNGLEPDFATIKYRGSDGAILWGPQFFGGSAGHGDYAWVVALDSAGNPVVAGTARNTGRYKDVVIVKYDGVTGATLWEPVIAGGLGNDDLLLNDMVVRGKSAVIAGKIGDYLAEAYDEVFGIQTLPEEIPPGDCGLPYTKTLTAGNATGTLTWSVVLGSLPPDLSLNASTGEISGMPTTLGSFAFRIRAQDSLGFVERDFVIDVYEGSAFVPIMATSGTVCLGQSTTLSVPGSWTSYHWLPGGEASSTINVSPTEATDYGVLLTDMSGCAARGYGRVSVGPHSVPIQAPSCVSVDGTGYAASVPDAGTGATYTWTVDNGAITSGAGTHAITFSAGAAATVAVSVTVVDATGCSATGGATLGICQTKFYTLTPCRLADTRDAPGPSGGPALMAGTVRTFPVAGVCQIPSTAKAVAVNLAVSTPSDGGDLRVYPEGQPAPLASSINFRPGIVRANNAIIPLGASGQISVQCDMPSGGTHFFFDVYGYFQ